MLLIYKWNAAQNRKYSKVLSLIILQYIRPDVSMPRQKRQHLEYGAAISTTIAAYRSCVLYRNIYGDNGEDVDCAQNIQAYRKIYGGKYSVAA